MHKTERTVLWVGVIALVIFALVLNGRVSDLQTTVQSHTATLNKPALETVVLPGVPAVFTQRWTKATSEQKLNPEDYLWLTVHMTNLGQSAVRDPAATLSLVPAISAIYPYSEWSWNTPQIAEGGQQDATQVKVIFPTLSQGESHTMFLAVQPEDFGTPPYDVQTKRLWADNDRLYWKTLTITTAEEMQRTQYGLASNWLFATQQTAMQ